MEDVKDTGEQPVVSTQPIETNNIATAPEVQAAVTTPEPPVAPAAEWQPVAQTPKRSWKRCFAYLPEYLVMLVLLITTVSAITALVGIGVDSLVKSEKTSGTELYSSYSQNFDSFQLVASLSALVVALPLFLVLYLRTKTIEAETPAVKTHRWRKGFLGTFLVIEGLAAIWTLVDLAYDLIGRVIGNDDGVFSFFSSGTKDPWWQVLIVAAINFALLAYTVFVMSRDYKVEQEQ